MTMNKKYITYTYVTLLTLLSLLPINGSSSALNNNYLLTIRWDYLVHAMIYLPVPVLVFLTWKSLPFWQVFVISLALGAGLELVQYLTSWRAFNLNDLVGNVVGVVLGSIGLLIYWGLRGRGLEVGG